MPKYKCENCDEIFEGEHAKQKIESHLFECVVVEMVDKKENKIVKQLKEVFSFIQSVEYEWGEFEEADKMIITRKDNTKYSVIYAWPNDKNEKEKEKIERIKTEIQKIEDTIEAIIKRIQETVPQSNIRFAGYVPNTGYLGNGYKFKYDTETATLDTDYFGGSIEDFAKRVEQYYVKEITGKLECFKGKYSIKGVSIEEWLERNKGKTCTIKSIG